jgi:AAA+ ATPase superfamily predicted ATPase
MRFIGRTEELALLEQHHASNRFELCVMYGRRRVGKTTLINKFVSGKPTIFFSALKTSAQENLGFFSEAVLQTLDSNLSGSVFASFDDALANVFRQAEEQRLILVIDEYPYLVESYPGISSLLQTFIDRNKDSSKLFLILNGSSMTQMRDEFFTHNRPLYGRKTMQLKVAPFGFYGIREYFSGVKPTQLPYIYAIYGGIPKYFETYRKNQSLKRNVIDDFLTIGAPLLEEPESVLKQEVRESSTYNTIFSAIAQEAHKYREISSKAKLESGNVSAYLDNLVFLDLIRREIPAYTGERKKTLYLVADNMFRFWFRFMPRNLSLVNSNRPEIALRYIEDNLEQFMGQTFEQICKEYLWRLNGTGELPFDFVDAGRWWGGDAQKKIERDIDLLAHDDAEQGLFCECKWSSARVGENILVNLQERSRLPQFSGLAQKHLMLFSKSGFTANCARQAAAIGNVSLVSLEEILA